MVEALVVVDVERRGLLVMERAAPLVLAPGLGELGGLADERAERGAAAEFVEELWG
jgi:hypothetical protein